MLPVGSVVLLKEATRYIIIIGYAPVEEGSTKIYDYLGCAYPIGVIGHDRSLLFDKSQIDKVIFEGYQDEEGKKFVETLTKEMENMR